MATTTAYIKEMINTTTSDIVYPVTKSQAVYMEDNSTTVQKAIDDLSALKNVPALDSQTSPNVSDLLTIFRNTNSTGYKALVSDVAKTIIESYQSSSLAGKTQSVKAALDSLNSSIIIDVSNKHTVIPNGSDFDSYTTPGVYYVMSDADGATMVNAPRKSSGKLIVMARHTAGYLAQYYYPSSSNFIRYIRSYSNNSWSVWIQQDINYENASNRQYTVGKISSESNKTFEECGLTKYQYGAYFVVLRCDTALDASWCGIVRHNSNGYQISEYYKGSASNAPYVTTSGIIKTDDSTAISCYAVVLPMNVW